MVFNPSPPLLPPALTKKTKKKKKKSKGEKLAVLPIGHAALYQVQREGLVMVPNKEQINQCG